MAQPNTAEKKIKSKIFIRIVKADIDYHIVIISYWMLKNSVSVNKYKLKCKLLIKQFTVMFQNIHIRC